MSPASRLFTRFVRKAPLRAVVILPFVLLIVATVGLTGYLSFLNGQKAVGELVGRLEEEVGDRIQETLTTYLKVPQLVTRINADAVRLGLVDLEDVEGTERYLWNQFQQFNGQVLTEQPTDIQPSVDQGFTSQQCQKQPSNNLTLIILATETGNYVDVGFNTKGGLEMSIRNPPEQANTQVWQVSCWGRRTKVAYTLPDYDPRQRPWYEKVKQVGKLVWTGPEPTYPPDSYLAIGAERPLYDRRGNFIGVADATISLQGISEFLRGLKIGRTGQTFIIQPNGSLIATSTSELPFVKGGEQEEPRTLNVLDSQNSLTQATAAYVQRATGGFNNISQPVSLEFRINGQRQFVKVQPLWDNQQLRSSTDQQGLNWLVVIVIPEQDFMAQITANTRITTLLCLIALIVAIAVGIATSRWITNPILKLSRAAEALAEGDWERQVSIQRSGELGTLASAFVHMREQLKRSRRQLEEYSRGLEQKNRELETLEADLRRQLNLFLHAVSHDLRNPVIGTSMVLQNLSQQSGNDLNLSRRILERMIEGNQRQLDLINSLIDTHAAEMWGIVLHTKPLKLDELVTGAIVDLQPILDKDRTALINQISPDLPQINGDPLQLGRVYQNLVANALKHNPPGLTITLDAHPEAAWIHCTVADNGIGISPEQCERLFDPYFRGAEKPKSVGLGLGLYLCRQIVQAHGGVIGVQSQPGKGTTFWFTLPAD